MEMKMGVSDPPDALCLRLPWLPNSPGHFLEADENPDFFFERQFGQVFSSPSFSFDDLF
jgi:hypothetical protein